MNGPDRRGGAVGKETWTSRQRVVGIFFLGYLAIQLGLPAAQLVESGPARFGWQMYWRKPPPKPDFVVLLRDTTWIVDPSPQLINTRWEIDLARRLPPHLCVLYPSADGIRMQWPDGRRAVHGCPAGTYYRRPGGP